MIQWHPKKEVSIDVLGYKIALLLTPDTERILIDSEENIRLKVTGELSQSIHYDVTNPLGMLLLSLNSFETWEEALKKMDTAQKIMAPPDWLRVFMYRSPIEYEKKSEQFLQEKYSTNNPLYQYVAERIWHGYWVVRGLKDRKQYKAYREMALNLAKPFTFSWLDIQSKSNISIDRNIVDQMVRTTADSEKKVATAFCNGTAVEYVLAEDSLVPLIRYYADYLEHHKAYCIVCKECGKRFAARSLKYQLCSDECRIKAKATADANRRADTDTYEIERMCRTADASWNNALKKYRKSPDWTETDDEKFVFAKDNYQDERTKKRRAYKHGQLPFTEFREWLVMQPVYVEDFIKRELRKS